MNLINVATVVRLAAHAVALGLSASRTAVAIVTNAATLSSASTVGWLMVASVKNSLDAQCKL